MSNLMNYNHADFEANPTKYSLFKTATNKSHFFGENGNDLAKGTIVGLTYLGTHKNRLYNRIEPMYQLHTGHTVYANSLDNFVL